MQKAAAAVLSLSVMIVVLVCTANPRVTSANNTNTERWVGTWACSPQLADADVEPPSPGFANSTLRQIVHVSMGGARIRVRFSNAFGRTTLTIASAHVAKAANGGAIQTASDKPLTFADQPTAHVPAGALIYSDPLEFDLAPLSDLAVTIQMKGAPEGITTHAGSRATSYLASGDAVSAAELPSAKTLEHWYFLNGIDVAASNSAAAAVILGDSITDGKGSTTNGNGRWPDILARRLQVSKHTKNVGVLNEGIGGNRLLHDGLGPNALARLDRDVLTQAGVRWVVILEGVNDIGTCADPCDAGSVADDIIAAYEQIIIRAHTQKIRVYGGTIPPFGDSFYARPEREDAREKVNHWIRTSGHFDAVLDFDATTRDQKNPMNLSAQMDSGDHLHPDDAGYKAMGDSIPLKLFAK